MSVEAPAATVEAAALRRSGYRIAFGVTGCFAVAEAMDWDFTFVGPMLAAQILVKLRRPPTLGQGIGLLAVVALTNGLVLLLSTALIAAPGVLILALGLLFCLTTYAQFRGAPDLVTMLLQIATVTIPVFAVVSPDTASGFATTLFQAAFVALMAVWAAFALFPAPGDPAWRPRLRPPRRRNRRTPRAPRSATPSSSCRSSSGTYSTLHRSPSSC